MWTAIVVNGNPTSPKQGWWSNETTIRHTTGREREFRDRGNATPGSARWLDHYHDRRD